MEIVSFIFEIIFLGIGIIAYRFSTGKIKAKTPESQANLENFRKENKGWLRIVSLLLIAIMCIELALHVMQLVTLKK